MSRGCVQGAEKSENHGGEGAFPSGILFGLELSGASTCKWEASALQYSDSQGLVKVSTGILKVGKLSDADRQTANLNINAKNNSYALAA